MQARLIAIGFGILIIAIGFIIEPLVVEQAPMTGGTSIGSFAGAKSIVDLLPIIYRFSIVLLGLGSIGIGVGGFLGKGPMSK